MVLSNWLNREDVDIEQYDILHQSLDLADTYYLILGITDEVVTTLQYTPSNLKGSRVINAFLVFPLDTSLFTWILGDEKQAFRAKITSELKDQTNLLLDQLLQNTLLLKQLGVDKLV